jgi:hypothetical protein
MNSLKKKMAAIMLGVMMSGFAATQVPNQKLVTNEILAVAVMNGSNREQLIASIGGSICIEVVCSAFAAGGFVGMGIFGIGCGA